MKPQKEFVVKVVLIENLLNIRVMHLTSQEISSSKCSKMATEKSLSMIVLLAYQFSLLQEEEVFKTSLMKVKLMVTSHSENKKSFGKMWSCSILTKLSQWTDATSEWTIRIQWETPFISIFHRLQVARSNLRTVEATTIMYPIKTYKIIIKLNLMDRLVWNKWSISRRFCFSRNLTVLIAIRQSKHSRSTVSATPSSS